MASIEDDINARDKIGVAPCSSEEFESEGHRCYDAAELFSHAQHRTNYTIYQTDAHKGIYNRLLAQSNSLVNDSFTNRQGENCITLIGAKGIGKTTSLKTFVTLSKYVVPNLYAIYISLNNIQIDKDLKDKTVLTVVLEMMKSLGFPLRDRADEDHIGHYLVAILREQKAKLLLLIDELDQLYKSTDKVALLDLHELSYLGNQPTGTVSVIVCGSSAMMEHLITTNASQPIREEFPLLSAGAPNLNGTKFQTRRVVSYLPTDLVTISILAEKSLTNSNIKWIRLVAFVAGASARSVGRVVGDSSKDGEIINSVSPEFSYTGANTLSKPHLAQLRAKILKKLYAKNAVLLNSIKNASDLTAAIADTSWEKGGAMEFLPLTYKEVQKIWKKLIKKEVVKSDESIHLDTSILHLADRGWIVIGTVRESHPTSIYPFSLFQVFQESIRDDVMPTVKEKIAETLKKGPVEVAKLVANPRSAVAAVAVATACGACIVM